MTSYVPTPRGSPTGVVTIDGNVEASLPTIQDAIDELRWAAIQDNCERIASYGRSAREAAVRRERLTIGVHFKQLRLTFLAAIEDWKRLGRPADDPSDDCQDTPTGRAPSKKDGA
jgi:hypothetical protein